ncbi:heterokaryon incompatibility protein-domain-containing protein [Xylariales sp. PMI_506]|nr:heterokaryon incompatibility protein-domain-containing protein [Xylariales sp. PMI_506]
MDIYQYRSLRSQEEEIRLFVLSPGEEDEPVAGELKIVSLRDRLQYDALSYVWGSPDLKHDIYIQGRVFKVVANLHKVLKDLRLRKKSRTLWIDAICINQSDGPERSKQVRLMTAIYAKASVTIAWLDEEIDPELEPFRQLRKLVKVEWRDGRTYLHPMRQLQLQMKARRLFRPHEPEFWDPVIQIFQNEYWTRLWVQQELLVSRTVIFHFRKTTLSSEGLFRFQGCLERDFFDLRRRHNVAGTKSHAYLARPQGYFDSIPEGRAIVEKRLRGGDGDDTQGARLPSYQKFEEVSDDLATLFLGSHQLNASDPRDYVYGCLALLPKAERDQVKVDYSLSITSIYAQVFRAKIKKEKCLNFLRFVSWKCPQHTLPSWLPAPTKSSVLVPGSSFDLSSRGLRDLPVEAEISTDGCVLSIRGIMVDMITKVLSREPTPVLPIQTWTSKLEEIYTGLQSSAKRSAESLIESPAELLAEPSRSRHPLWKTPDFLELLMDYWYSRNSWGGLPTTEGMVQIVESIINLPQKRKQPELTLDDASGLTGFHPHFYDTIAALQQTVFFATSMEMGLLALANPGVHPIPGDQLWFIVGCPIPVVLRPQSEEPRRFTYVGITKVSGMMKTNPADTFVKRLNSQPLEASNFTSIDLV